MKIAKCNIGSPVYVPAGEHLDGAVLESPAWARQGTHFLGHDFAHTQEAIGMLEIMEIDGAPVIWGACCAGH